MTRASAVICRATRCAALLSVLLLAACGQPVPPERASYVGAWEGSGVFLVIDADGSVRYRRIQDGSKTSIEAPLVGFVGDDFEVGVGPLTTTFDVTAPPRREGERWIMVVDGVTLVRADFANAAANGRW